LNSSNYVIFDFETDGLNVETLQPLQIAAVVVNPRNLQLYEGAHFSSYIRPDFTTLNRDVLEKNKILESDLKDAPLPKVVWKDFAKWVSDFDVVLEKGKKKPIPVGYNIKNYDLPIYKRLNSEYKVKDFFSPFNVDVLELSYCWFENNTQVQSLSLDFLRNFFKLPTKGAHNAIVDVQQTAEIFIEFMKTFRHLGERIKWS
jgi:DNA polymerase III alpha subunit (gram-positive type)